MIIAGGLIVAGIVIFKKAIIDYYSTVIGK
jgi:hypothetical protein